MKLYQWDARSRHENARSAKPHTFYGEYAVVTDPQGYARRDLVSTYRWMRQGGVPAVYARYLAWRMVANPIAHAPYVEVRNDLRTKAGAA